MTFEKYMRILCFIADYAYKNHFYQYAQFSHNLVLSMENQSKVAIFKRWYLEESFSLLSQESVAIYLSVQAHKAQIFRAVKINRKIES